MNNNIEVVVPNGIEAVPIADFKVAVKSYKAVLKVVDDHYRWVYEKDGRIIMLLPEK